MVLTVLVVNDFDDGCGLDLRCIVEYFKSSFCRVIESRSIEEALSVAGHENLDLAILTLSKKSCSDFLSILRIALGVTPLIGVADVCSPQNFPFFSDKGVDDILYSDISREDLFRKVNSLSEAREKMYSSFLVKDLLGKQKKKRVTVCSDSSLNLFDREFSSGDTVIDYMRADSDLKEFASTDLFLINAEIHNVEEVCANLKLCSLHRHKPVLLVSRGEDKEKAVSVYNKNIGVKDIIYTDVHPSIISCKVNAHIKYKRLLDGFYREVKRNTYMSSVDALTTVYNRSFLEDFISRRENAMNHSAVLMIDLDKFKIINDKYGHAFADKVLSEVAMHIKSYIRLTDCIARYGGDEFVVFLRNISLTEIEKISERLVHSVAEKLFNGIHCTISIGACYIDKEEVKLREAIFIADSFMYISKKSGGNSVYFC